MYKVHAHSALYIYIYIYHICTRDININTESDKGKGGEVPVTQCTDIFEAMNGDTRHEEWHTVFFFGIHE